MASKLPSSIDHRAQGACEVCHDKGVTLVAYEVSHAPTPDLGLTALCHTCEGQLSGRLTVEPKHWYCLQESIWSEVAAVQVLSYRQLHALKAETWAGDVLANAYLEDELMQWAEATLKADAEDAIHRDMNGTQLHQGDSITLTRSLDVKGTNFTVKRGETVKNIRLSDDVGWVDAKVNGVEIFIKTCFVKRVH